MRIEGYEILGNPRMLIMLNHATMIYMDHHGSTLSVICHLGYLAEYSPAAAKLLSTPFWISSDLLCLSQPRAANSGQTASDTEA